MIFVLPCSKWSMTRLDVLQVKHIAHIFIASSCQIHDLLKSVIYVGEVLKYSNDLNETEFSFFLFGGQVFDRSGQPANPSPDWINQSMWDSIVEADAKLESFKGWTPWALRHGSMDQLTYLPWKDEHDFKFKSNPSNVLMFFLEPRGTRLKWPISSPCRIRLEIGGLITCLVFICIYIYIYIMLYMYDLVISDVVSQ